MKKSLILAGLILASVCGFAQKSQLKEVKMSLYGEGADFSKARRLMEEILDNPQYQNNAECWYWAGMIGYEQNSQQQLLRLAGSPINQDAAGQAVIESLGYFIKADSIAMTPTLDKKGREVVDTKMHAKVQKAVKEYYTKQYIVAYGIYLNDQEDFVGAYHAFKAHLSIPTLAMMQDEKSQAEMPIDSTYMQYKYYMALFAIQAELHKEAIAVLNEMKDGNTEPIAVNQFLYQEYVTLKDTANFVNVLQQAVWRFPQEPWFLQNLINYYIFSNQEVKAIEYLDKAIEREPNVAQYHLIKGNLSEEQKNYEVALAEFDKALELDPKMADAAAGKGRVYYNQAVRINEEASYIADAKEYQLALEDMNEMFRKSLPFFEQAHKIAPDNRDYMVTLKGLYYRFSMDDKYKAIQEELEK